MAGIAPLKAHLVNTTYNERSQPSSVVIFKLDYQSTLTDDTAYILIFAEPIFCCEILLKCSLVPSLSVRKGWVRG